MKLEFLALHWAVAIKFRDILIGAKFVVFTDNNPLKYLQSTARLGAQEMRWQSELAVFKYTVEYRPGKQNQNADSLSRKVDHGPDVTRYGLVEEIRVESRMVTVPYSVHEMVRENTAEVWQQEVKVRSSGTEPKAVFTLPAIPKDHMEKLQGEDPVIGRFHHHWKSGQPPQKRVADRESKGTRKLLSLWDVIKARDGLLYREATINNSSVEQLLLPEVLKQQVLEALHDQCGHQASQRTLSLA